MPENRLCKSTIRAQAWTAVGKQNTLLWKRAKRKPQRCAWQHICQHNGIFHKCIHDARGYVPLVRSKCLFTPSMYSIYTQNIQCVQCPGERKGNWTVNLNCLVKNESPINCYMRTIMKLSDVTQATQHVLPVTCYGQRSSCDTSACRSILTTVALKHNCSAQTGSLYTLQDTTTAHPRSCQFHRLPCLPATRRHT